MGTKAYSIHPTLAQQMIGGTSTYAEYLGASPLIKFYSGTVPTSAAAALSGNTVLATLTGAATPISGTSDTGTAGRATWAAIASATAAATGTCTFFRTFKADGTTVVDQGNVDTTGADINLSTTALTAGSTVSLSSRTSDLPYGP